MNPKRIPGLVLVLVIAALLGVNAKGGDAGRGKIELPTNRTQ